MTWPFAKWIPFFCEVRKSLPCSRKTACLSLTLSLDGEWRALNVFGTCSVPDSLTHQMESTFVVTMSINIANRTAAKRSRSVPIVILRCRDITTPNPICVLRFNAFQSRLFLHLILRFATLNGVKIYVLMYLTVVTFCVYIWQSTLNCVYTFGGCCCCCKVVSLDLLFPFFSIFIHSFLVNLPVLNAFKL